MSSIVSADGDGAIAVQSRADPRPHPSERLYDSDFVIAYLANLLVVTANTLTFRFADFVKELGGSATDAGFIIGFAMGVSVLVRIAIGREVDLRGPRHLWIASAAAMGLSGLGFASLHSLGPAIYLLRILYQCGLAGVFSCSVIHLCTGAPIERRAELIGTLGTSGFIGMVLGPQIGDWLFQSPAIGEHRFLAMFISSAVLNFGYAALVVYLTRHSVRPPAHEPPSLGRMLVDYWPGTLVAVAMMMGMAQTIPQAFLTLFREARQLEGIGKFFWCYAPTAILMRLAGRRWPEQLGRRKSAVIGLTCVATSMVLYLIVDHEWDLAWSALAAGIGQALLFPAVTTLGAESFPERYRATGTTLILSFVDVGGLCGAPVLGWMIDRGGFDLMFLSAAATVVVVTIAFAAATHRARGFTAPSSPASTSTEVPLPSIAE